jgi:protein-disulfide isomerase
MAETNKQQVLVYGLAGLLVVAAFGLGSLWTRVRQLEQGQNQKVLAGQAAGANQPIAGAPSPKPAGEVPSVTDKDHLRGNKDAQIVLVEYSDFECPFCKQFQSTMQQVLAEYDDQVAWVYRHYPLNFHANAQKEAEASECANELGGNEAFWRYSDAIFERTTSNGTGFALDNLVPLAGELGLNQTAFQECLDSGKYSQQVKDEMAGGQKAGVTGTPGTILITKDGKTQLISGALPFDQIKQTIGANL